MQTLSHPYRPKPRTMALVSLFFGSCAAFMGHRALVNDRELVINGLVHLEPGGATVFYAAFAAVSALFVGVGLRALAVGLLSSHRVTLTATAISAPRLGFSRETTVVKLADIRDLRVNEVRRQRFLTLYHADGKLAIHESFLPDRAAFESLCAAIRSRVHARRGR